MNGRSDPAPLPPRAAAGVAGLACIVLGGGGFIGTNLCRALLAGGARVRAFGRSLPFPEALAGVAWTFGTLDGQDDLARVIDGAEVVFHLIGSGLPEASNRNPAANVSASILATVHLLEVCRDCGVRRVVFASSGGTVYGVTPRTPTPETAPTEPISAYGINKLAIEKYLALYRYLYDLDYVALRIGNPYGPFQTAMRRQGVIAALMRRAMAGLPLEIWGDGNVVRDFVHVADVVEAMLALLGYAGAHRIFNVGSGVGRSINAVAADIERLLGAGALPRIFQPAQRADVPANVLDIALIRREAGWAPRVPWLAGLSDTVEWLRTQRVG